MRKRVRLLLIMLLMMFCLTACGVKKFTVSLSNTDQLEAVTGGVADARNEYLTAAANELSSRGVSIVLQSDNESTLGQIDVRNLTSSTESLSAFDDLAKCVLMTTGANRQGLSGTFTLELESGETAEVAYEFMYGTARCHYTEFRKDGERVPARNATSDCEQIAASESLFSAGTSGWVLWMDIEGALGKLGLADQATAKAIMEALNSGDCFALSALGKGKCVGIDDGQDGCGSEGATAGYIIDANMYCPEQIGIVFNFAGKLGGDYKWKIEPAATYPEALPLNDKYGAFGLGINTAMNASTSQVGTTRIDCLIRALLAMCSSSTVVSPSNFESNATTFWTEPKNNSAGYLFGDHTFVRQGSAKDWAAGGEEAFSWNGTVDPTKVSNGYEVLTSTVIDYGRIYVLSEETNPSDVAALQKKLNSFFADGKTSVVTNTEQADGKAALDGSAVLTNFKSVDVCVVPPGFGILCYSMIPRTGILNMTNAGGVKVGVVHLVGEGTGNGKPSLALGFVGPNPSVISGMNNVLSSAGGGFCVINEKICLMTYPVAALNYLYSNDDQTMAYLGFGAAPVYYNLVYDRLDYKYGNKYQYMNSANSGISDPELYGDFNFAGGVSVKDQTNMYSDTGGGVCILQDDNGKNICCRVQIAAKDNVAAAKKTFSDMVDTYYLRNVPLWDVDNSVSGNQAFKFQPIVKPDGTTLPATTAADYMHTGDGGILELIGGNTYFKDSKALGPYLDRWEDSLNVSSLTVPQFVLLDYVETTLLPGAAGNNNIAVTGRKIRLLQGAMQYDSAKKLFYYAGNTSTHIANYVSMDGSQVLDKLCLGDVVDVRALGGAGYSKRCGDLDGIQPPNGYNSLFPIGVSYDDYKRAYAEEAANGTLSSDITDWVNSYAGGASLTPEKLQNMSHWDGYHSALVGTTETRYADDEESSIEAVIQNGSKYYQTISAVNNVSTMVRDGEEGELGASVVACLNIQGADQEAHLGVTEVDLNTKINDLPYVPTDMITFSEPFPNILFETDDARAVFATGVETESGVAMPNVMFTVCVGTGITHGNFYNGWVTSEAPTDSLAWWNGYLEAHNFKYKVNTQVVEEYLETNYSYLANEGNRIMFDVDAAEYWSEELDITNPNRGGNKLVGLIATASNIVGWLCIVYGLLCIMLWAVDIFGGLEKDFYRIATGGRYIASAEPMPSSGTAHYATFLNAAARTVLLCIVGALLLYVGAGVLLAKMFKYIALILRFVFNYWANYKG